MYYTGMRWGELVGLETRYVRPGLVRIEWQLYELEGEGFIRCPPKDDSRRDADLPAWLSALVSGHVARTAPRPCDCHRLTYVFRGRRPSAGTRSSGAHWRRSGFGDWVFESAASGWYPKKAPQPRRPVSLAADPWPGRPLRGRNNAGRAEACWLPVAGGPTPHGLRHAHKSLMGELKIPEVLAVSGCAAPLLYFRAVRPSRLPAAQTIVSRWQADPDRRAVSGPRTGSGAAALVDVVHGRAAPWPATPAVGLASHHHPRSSAGRVAASLPPAAPRSSCPLTAPESSPRPVACC
jgi:hypothetical protein